MKKVQRAKRPRIRSVLLFQNFSLFVDPLDKGAFDAALHLYEALDTPVSLSMYLKLKYGEWRSIAEAKIAPTDYEKSWAFESDFQAVSFLSKYPYLPTGIDRKEVATQAFRDAEEECLKTNRRIRRLVDDPQSVDPDLRQVLWLAGRKVQLILGDLDWEEFSRSTGWGPGATNVAKGHYTSGYNKFSGPLSSTNGNLALGLCCVNSTPSWASWQAGEIPDDMTPPRPVTVLPSAVQIVKGGKIIFVPKNAKTDRSIIVPVSLNSYVQKGFGRMIRRRLKRAGIDLNDQTFNQMHALRGSQFNDRSTLDAKAASDTVATELVRYLVPDEWFDALSSGREPYGYLASEDSWIHFQKFSAMGNSYTFELESLIFYALCQASVEVSRRNGSSINEWTGQTFPNAVSVFGDDMVVPRDCVPLVLKVLSFSGFTMNMSKTFVDGPFRESCGKDYFLGTLVRPIFLKERLQNAEAIYKLANNVRRIAHRRSNYDGCDGSLRVVWLYLVSILPEHQRRLRICEGVGDGGLISNWDEARPSRAQHGHEGWRLRSLMHVPVRERMHQYRPAMAAYLMGNAEDDEHEQFADRAVRPSLQTLRRTAVVRPDRDPRDSQFDLRGRTSQKIATITVRKWYDLGPWRQ